MNADKLIHSLDTYLGLCTEVYELSKSQVPKEAYAFYLDYAIRANGLILEPMCGTGRFLLPMFQEGLNIHGFDASKHMLKVLHDKANSKNLSPIVWQGFAQDLKRKEQYNLIFIPSGSFSLIIDLENVERTVKGIYEHLNDGGIFLFEAETLQAVPQQEKWRESTWYKPNGTKIVLSQLATLKEDICSSICKYELIEAGKVINTEIEELKVRIYKQDQLIGMLKSVGFKHIKTIKAFDHSKSPSKEDKSIVYECRK